MTPQKIRALIGLFVIAVLGVWKSIEIIYMLMKKISKKKMKKKR